MGNGGLERRRDGRVPEITQLAINISEERRKVAEEERRKVVEEERWKLAEEIRKARESARERLRLAQVERE